MLSKRKELHFKVNSVVESTLIHCREKKQRGRRGKRKSFFKKWQVYAWGLLVFLAKVRRLFNMERDRHKKRRFGTDSKIHQYGSADGKLTEG